MLVFTVHQQIFTELDEAGKGVGDSPCYMKLTVSRWNVTSPAGTERRHNVEVI